jgi:hypothetical protein
MEELVTHDDEIYCEDCFDDHYYSCTDCETIEKLPAPETANGHDYCEHCYNERYIACERCSDACERDSTTTVHTGHRRSQDWCEDCTSQNASRCSSCDEHVRDDDTTSDGHGNCLCMSCYEDSYFTCEGCDEVCNNDDYAENGYCESCWKERGLGKIQRLIDRLNDPAIRAIRVLRDDSTDAGNCTPGTDAFIREHFSNLYDWCGVTIGQIVDAVCPDGLESLSQDDMDYAKQIGIACLHAIRRSGRNI